MKYQGKDSQQTNFFSFFTEGHFWVQFNFSIYQNKGDLQFSENEKILSFLKKERMRAEQILGVFEKASQQVMLKF